MSLINDALKRASEVRPNSQLDPSAARLLPAESGTRKSTWTWVWHAVAVMTAAVLASWAMIAGYLASRQLKLASIPTVAAREVKQTATQPSNTDALETSKPGQAPQPAVPVTSSIVAQSVIPGVGDTNVSGSAQTVPGGTNTASAAQVSEPPKPVAPTFKLQAIF